MTLREELRTAYMRGFREAVAGSPCPEQYPEWMRKIARCTTMYEHGHARGLRTLARAERDGWQVAASVLVARGCVV